MKMDYLDMQNNVEEFAYTIIHEVFHALGFSSSVFKEIEETENKKNESRNKIKE